MRRRFVTEGVLRLMRQLEAEKLSRKEIAERLDLDPATVTRHLGPVRKYEWRRMNLDEDLEKPEKHRAQVRYWRAMNPDKCNTYQASRRARQRNLTPPLSAEERASIVALYAKARELTKLTGEPHHVDHIKPLVKGGLHHPNNLQVLPGIENQKKGRSDGPKAQ